MANLQSLYRNFGCKITLSQPKRDSLRKSRDNLRNQIRTWFIQAGKNVPKFCWQGSYAMKTLVNPLPDGDYDLDDGIYFQCCSDNDNFWPTPGTVHKWIQEAVCGQTNEKPINKDTCIRVCYAKGYHIDLPAYILKDNVAYLAHKGKGWIESDPKAFKEWFVNNVKCHGEQLRSVVKYLKAWKDYKGIQLKGIEITILAVENFLPCMYRDDMALRSTVENMIKTLYHSFSCRKPVSPYEDLFSGCSQYKKYSVIKGLKELKSSLDYAILEENEKLATIYMQLEFGSRFSLS